MLIRIFKSLPNTENDEEKILTYNEKQLESLGSLNDLDKNLYVDLIRLCIILYPKKDIKVKDYQENREGFFLMFKDLKDIKNKFSLIILSQKRKFMLLRVGSKIVRNAEIGDTVVVGELLKETEFSYNTFSFIESKKHKENVIRKGRGTIVEIYNEESVKIDLMFDDQYKSIFSIENEQELVIEPNSMVFEWLQETPTKKDHILESSIESIITSRPPLSSPISYSKPIKAPTKVSSQHLLEADNFLEKNDDDDILYSNPFSNSQPIKEQNIKVNDQSDMLQKVIELSMTNGELTAKVNFLELQIEELKKENALLKNSKEKVVDTSGLVLINASLTSINKMIKKTQETMYSAYGLKSDAVNPLKNQIILDDEDKKKYSSWVTAPSKDCRVLSLPIISKNSVTVSFKDFHFCLNKVRTLEILKGICSFFNVDILTLDTNERYEIAKHIAAVRSTPTTFDKERLDLNEKRKRQTIGKTSAQSDESDNDDNDDYSVESSKKQAKSNKLYLFDGRERERLLKNQYLNDTIIAKYIATFIEPELPQDFNITTVEFGTCFVSPMIFTSNLKKASKHIATDKINFLMLNPPGHWCLSSIRFQYQQIIVQFYDSYSPSCMQKFENIIEEKLIHHYPNFSVSFVYVKVVQQPNNRDCGLYMLSFLSHVCKTRDFDCQNCEIITREKMAELPCTLVVKD